MEPIGDFADGPIEGLQFKRLTGPDNRVPNPPRFTFGTFPAELATDFYKLGGISSIGVHVARDVSLSGNFLLTRGDRYFRAPELNIHQAHIKTEVARREAMNAAQRRLNVGGQNVMLAGPGYPVYGHWLVEYLPKIGLLHAAGYDVHALKYLLPTSTPSYVHQWLDLLGIGAHQIVPYDPDAEVVTADELLLPTITHNGNRVSRVFKDAAFFLMHLIMRGHEIGRSPYGERIFLSRSQASQARSLVNRERIEEMATAAGFTMVHPEKLPLIEQVRLFAGARQLMGEYGSALHGSIFSPPGAVVCALRGTALHPGFIQSGMGEVLDQPTGYVIGETNLQDRAMGFSVDEAAFGACLSLIFGRVPL